MKEYECAMLCYYYLRANEQEQKRITDMMTDEQKEAFQRMVGFFRIMTDKAYRDKIADAVLKMYCEHMSKERG